MDKSIKADQLYARQKNKPAGTKMESILKGLVDQNIKTHEEMTKEDA